MLCERPFVKDGKAFGCGQCFPCRFNRRRIWTHRILLEAAQYAKSCFATLTYRDENLMTSSGLPATLEAGLLASLQPEDLRDFLKRLRKAIAPTRIRFYAVGEYGDESWRPHYHVALFGFDGCARGRTLRRPGSGRPRWEECCELCRLVGEKWKLGDVDLGMLEPDSAQYLAGYVTKKMTAYDDDRLNGRHPEFARMSNRPGIGYDAMHEVASVLMEHGLENGEDVPGSLRHGKRELPLGRYLQQNLRKMVGRDAKAPEAVLARFAAELSEVRREAFENSEHFGKALARANEQARRNFYSKQKLRKKVKTL